MAPIRVLLIARQAGDWWSTRLPDLIDDVPVATVALEAAHILELGPVDAAEARREAFQAAGRAFADKLGHAYSGLDAPDLTAPSFAAILFVHLAALSALQGETERLAGQGVGQDLIAFALRREARYWVATANDRDLDLEREVLFRAVAIATITVAGSEDEAASVLSAIPDLAEAPARLRPTARWLRTLYPGPVTHTRCHPSEAGPWFRPLIPDLLGETLIARVVNDLPLLPARLLARASASQTHRALSVLNQAARQHPDVAVPLKQALTEHFSTVWATAVSAALEVGDPLAGLLAEVLEETPRPEIAT